MILNNNTPFCDLESIPDNDASKINNAHVISRGCLILLSAGSSVYVKAATGFDNAISTYGETSFRGFFYYPKQGNSIAWSVCANDDRLIVNGIIQFTEVYVNTGVWSPSSYAVTITTAGTYFMEIGSQSYYYGNTDMKVVVNGNTVALRLLIASPYCGALTRSRSAIINLYMGDTLKVQCVNCDMTGDRAGGIYFHGILLMAN